MATQGMTQGPPVRTGSAGPAVPVSSHVYLMWQVRQIALPVFAFLRKLPSVLLCAL
jgi:hypothetical protein